MLDGTGNLVGIEGCIRDYTSDCKLIITATTSNKRLDYKFELHLFELI